MLEVNKIYCANCLDLMKDIPDKSVDLILTDPPFGIGMHIQIGKKKGERGDKWDASDWDNFRPDKRYFDELFRVSKNQIIWGGNYFDLPATRCFLIWDKVQRIDFADCEMAWTSFGTSARIYSFARSNMQGFRFPERKHPTQKPVPLYQWCIKNYSKETDLILDPFCGSGTTCLAAKMLGRRFIGIDISQAYVDIAEERLKDIDTGVPVKEARKGQMSLLEAGDNV